MADINNKWTVESITALYERPLFDLLYEAQRVLRDNFPPNEMQLSNLLSIKTGTCPEDCRYCSQSGHYKTGVKKEKLLDVDEVLAQAKIAKAKGVTRFCMGAAWRSPPKRDLPKVLEIITEVKKLGLETCATLGMLDEQQAIQLKAAGLDYYNHNLDTSEKYYAKVATTRSYQDRLETLKQVRKADINVCCGGIFGMGEKSSDRIELLAQLANLPKPPESVPINRLMRVAGTPFADLPELDNFELVRTIACARIVMPKTMVRLSAGRIDMSDELQALCYLAGANSIHVGDVLLTEPNPSRDKDLTLLAKLGLKPQTLSSAETIHD